jgi:hypothetical protein
MSSTYIANIVALLALGLPVLGFEVVEEETLTQLIVGVVGFVALVYNFYGRYKAGGITAFGVRKAE